MDDNEAEELLSTKKEELEQEFDNCGSVYMAMMRTGDLRTKLEEVILQANNICCQKV